MTTMIPIAMIGPNPWQPRLTEDPQHIQDLALSIARDGLMQIPMVRCAPANESATLPDLSAPYQLAFGHSRLAAYKFLNAAGNPGYTHLPVILRNLTDEQMFSFAINENVQRKDLTPIESARAMLRYRDEFGKTSAEIGQLFGLSESAVRNKIRLLNLPPEVQAGFSSANLSEGAARALLTLYDLPESVLKKAEADWYTEIKPSRILADALAGGKAEEISQRVAGIVLHHGKPINNLRFRYDQAMPLDDHYRSQCTGCECLVRVEKTNYCVYPPCAQAKDTAAVRAILEEASAELGIPAIEDDRLIEPEVRWDGRITNPTPAHLQAARSAKCPNLRLVYHHNAATETGFPNVMVICSKSSGRCTCQTALAANISLTPAAKPNPITPPAESTQPPAAPDPITLTDMETINRQIRQQKRQDKAEALAMRDDTAKIMAQALIGQNPYVWRQLWKLIDYRARDMEFPPDWEYHKLDLLEEIAYQLGLKLANDIHNPDVLTLTADQARDRYNAVINVAGLPGFSSPDPTQ